MNFGVVFFFLNIENKAIMDISKTSLCVDIYFHSSRVKIKQGIYWVIVWEPL